MRLATLMFAVAIALACPLVGLAQTEPASLPSTCRNSYTQQQEIELGDKVVREVYKSQPVLPDSDPTAQFVRRLGAQLVAAAPVTPGLEQQWPFNFHVVASDEINAFALPGGTMFVNLGAIQAAETEAQLAGVMAHEMSHVILRHSTCNLVRQKKKSIWYTLGAVGSALALGGAGGDLAAQGIGAVQNLDFLHMSRGDEKQADLLGVRIEHDTGFDPRGLPQFFEIIVGRYGQGGAQFLSDHPNPGNRTEYLNAEIASLPPLSHPVVSTPVYTSAHAQAAKVHALTAAELKTGAWKSSGLYAASPGARAPAPAGSRAQAAYRPTDTVGAGEAAIRDAEDSAPGGGSASAPRSVAGLPPLSSAQLGLSNRLVRVQGSSFSIAAPAGWTRVNSSAASDLPTANTLALAPLGGAGSFGLAYGVVLGVLQQQGEGVTGAAALGRAADSLTAALLQSHNLQPEGAASTLQVGGQPAVSRLLRGASPIGGPGAAERDWLVLVGRPDGDVDVLLFVAPTAQFATLQPLFNNMLASFRPQ